MEEMLTVSSISDYVYCPRNFYLRTIEKIDTSDENMLVGAFLDEKRNERGNKNVEEGRKERAVALTSETLGIRGTVDEVLFTEMGIIPIEYKKGTYTGDVKEHQTVQLALYALLLEEAYGENIQTGYIYYSGSKKRMEVSLDESFKSRSLDYIEEVRKVIREGLIPSVRGDAKCEHCSLLEECIPTPEGWESASENIKRKVLASKTYGRLLFVEEHKDTVRLKKKDGRIIAIRGEEVLFERPMIDIDQIMITGNVQISTQLMIELMERHISVSISDGHGRCKGWLTPVMNRNSILRMKQAVTAQSEEFRVKQSREIVRGKLSNMRTLLQRYNREIHSEKLQDGIQQISSILKKIDRTESISELLGYEGFASRAYFGMFSDCIKREGFAFEKRSRIPPKDPLNAMISYGYSVLINDIKNEIIRVGLDPYIGVYHANLYGRPALALDLAEEFRSVLVDSTVLTAINKGMIEKDDFEKHEGGCFLNETGRKQMMKAYRNRLDECYKHPVFESEVEYRRIMELQVRLFAKTLTKELETYIPFALR